MFQLILKNTQNLTLVLMAAIFLSPITAQGEWIEKPSTSINFNSMIDETQNKKNEIAEDLNEALVQAQESPKSTTKDALEDEKKVTDFVDVELGWGEAPKMVDRRFNSEGEAKVVSIN